MSDFLTGHLDSVIFFLLILVLIVLSNLYYLRPLSPVSENSEMPLVSVLIPARNEEHNIRRCIECLEKQSYPFIEVIVLNDNSQDATETILKELNAIDFKFKLTVIKGTPLPEGWVGKPRACHQLSELAAGELLLFIDADTFLETAAVSTAVKKMLEKDYDLISLMPRQETKTTAEKLVVPVVLWSIMLFLPLVLAYRLKNSFLAATVGQFMLFRGNTYKRLGGHKAVKSEVVDDLAMAKHFKKNNTKWGLFNGVNLLSCRMYRNSSQVYEGFAKNLFGVFDYRLLPHIFIWLWVANVFILPAILVSGIIVEVLAPGTFHIQDELRYKAVFALLVSLLIWLTVNANFQIPLKWTIFYPISVFLVSLIAMISVYRYLKGTRVWKDRIIEQRAVKWW